MVTRYLIILTCLLGIACRYEHRKPASEKKPIQNVQVKVLPLGDVDTKYIRETYDSIRSIAGHAVLLQPVKMPDMAYYKPRSRYRADSLIHWMSGLAKPGEIYIGVTSQDISTTKGKHVDYGVMGLGYCPGKACIVSSYRLKNKKNFYKLVIHELGHNMGLQHCPLNTCFMRDAKGGDPTGDEHAFCKNCTAFLQKKGWRL